MVWWRSGLLPWCLRVPCSCAYVCVYVHACSSSRAPWPMGALLSDWQQAGELYDGAVSPAVSLSLGSGSPDILRNTSECNFSLIFSELSFEWKNPTDRLAPFIFRTVQAKDMIWWFEHRNCVYTCTLVECVAKWGISKKCREETFPVEKGNKNFMALCSKYTLFGCLYWMLQSVLKCFQ